MDVIPVLDLVRGVAVWPVAGDRARYDPLASAVAPGATGDALVIRQGYRRAPRRRPECYLADLDAIQGRPMQRPLLRELAPESGPASRCWWTRGSGTPAAARTPCIACGASVDRGRARDAARVRRPRPTSWSWSGRPGSSSASTCVRESRSFTPPWQATGGAARMPVSPRVAGRGRGRPDPAPAGHRTGGHRCGVDLGLLEALRQRCPRRRLLAGGGVRTRRDLDRVRDAGCDGVLVASAIHSGGIGAAGDLAGLAAPRPLAVSRRRATRGRSPTARSSPRPRAPAASDGCTRPGSARPAPCVPRYCASISAVLFWIGSRAQSRVGKT